MIDRSFSKIFKISKKDLIIILAISALFCIPIITNLGEGDDLYYHLNRIEGIAQGLKAHTFPVYIYPYHNYGFGYAAPMFYSDVFLYIPSILYLLGCPIMIVYKLTLCFFVLLGNYVVFKILRTLYNKDEYIYRSFSVLLWRKQSL